jgi:hypothetical protein
MSAFPNWHKFAVHQRRPSTGCIPTGFEMLLRAAGAVGINFASFQDDFDLDQYGGQSKNHFVSVGAAINAKYPKVEFVCEPFGKGKGADKLARVEELLQKQQPLLVSLAQSLAGGWHIMPVVDADDNSLTLLEYVDQHGVPTIISIQKSEFVMRHNTWNGGEEIAYLVRF